MKAQRTNVRSVPIASALGLVVTFGPVIQAEEVRQMTDIKDSRYATLEEGTL